MVSGDMPNRRKDSAICFELLCQKGKRIRGLGTRTLLFGLKENTISECTFRLRSLLPNRSLTARYAAARACSLETT